MARQRPIPLDGGSEKDRLKRIANNAKKAREAKNLGKTKAGKKLDKSETKSEVKEKTFEEENVGVSAGPGKVADKPPKLSGDTEQVKAENRANKLQAEKKETPRISRVSPAKMAGAPRPIIKNKKKQEAKTPAESRPLSAMANKPDSPKKAEAEAKVKKVSKKFFTRENLGKAARGFAKGFEAGSKIETPGGLGGVAAGLFGGAKAIESEKDREAGIKKASEALALKKEDLEIKRTKAEGDAILKGQKNFILVKPGEDKTGAQTIQSHIDRGAITEKAGRTISPDLNALVKPFRVTQIDFRKEQADLRQAERDANREHRNKIFDRDTERWTRMLDISIKKAGNDNERLRLSKERIAIANRRASDKKEISLQQDIVTDIDFKLRDRPNDPSLLREKAQAINKIAVRSLSQEVVWTKPPTKLGLSPADIITVDFVEDLPKNWQSEPGMSEEDVITATNLSAVRKDQGDLTASSLIKLKKIYAKAVVGANRPK